MHAVDGMQALLTSLKISAKSVMLRQVAALEAVLEPGDSLIFPAKWAHHTESMDNSISVTYRLGPRRPATARLAETLRPYRACHNVVKCLLV